MSLTSKSPQDVAREALAAGTAALTPYSHKFSPKTFTQPQLLACLTLRQFFKTDYRGIVVILQEHAELRAILGLSRAPHFTTLQKAAARLLAKPHFRALLRCTIRRLMGRRRTVRRAAADSSGFPCGHASRYYIRRCAKGKKGEQTPAQTVLYTRYVKLELVLDTATHLIIGALESRGPAPDVDRLVPLLDEANLQVKIKTLCADAGYDSEFNHVVARQGCGVRLLAPAKHGRPSAKPPTGHWRKRMRKELSTKTKRRRSGYTQRVQSETGFSMIKRRQGEAVAARKPATQSAELRLMALTHNIMILYVWWGFLQSPLDAVSPKVVVSGVYTQNPTLTGWGSLKASTSGITKTQSTATVGVSLIVTASVGVLSISVPVSLQATVTGGIEFTSDTPFVAQTLSATTSATATPVMAITVSMSITEQAGLTASFGQSSTITVRLPPVSGTIVAGVDK